MCPCTTYSTILELCATAAAQQWPNCPALQSCNVHTASSHRQSLHCCRFLVSTLVLTYAKASSGTLPISSTAHTATAQITVVQTSLATSEGTKIPFAISSSCDSSVQQNMHKHGGENQSPSHKQTKIKAPHTNSTTPACLVQSLQVAVRVMRKQQLPIPINRELRVPRQKRLHRCHRPGIGVRPSC